MERKKNEIINIFDFDGTLTTETWPKFWVWVEKFGYNGIQRNDELGNVSRDEVEMLYILG